ncbi:MAG: hypothetical protein ACRCT8_17935 [Lacipirellulaceae bacterium]
MSDLGEARRLWNEGNGYDAGLLAWKHVDVLCRPSWAACILEVMMCQAGIENPLLAEVLECAFTPTKWPDGHTVFNKVRCKVIELDERLTRQNSLDLKLEHYILSLAELVAKLAYNATLPDDEFDEDSGAWVVAVARGFVTVVDDNDFDLKVWNAVYTAA